MRIDLHCHSHFSDGEHAPEYLVEQAITNNLDILALTDHDTLVGIPHLAEAAKGKSLKIINGIELSVSWKKYDIHVLGFNINPQSDELQNLLDQQITNRIKRAQEIGKKLEQCGIANAYKKALDLAGHERISRLHYAEILVAEGKVKDRRAAFKQYLGRSGKAFVPSAWVDIQEGVKILLAAGGQPVIAHPLKYCLTRTKLFQLFEIFKFSGGVGIELISGENTQEQINWLLKFCQIFDFVSSSGSDFHGNQSSRISLGQQQQLPVNCKPIWTLWNL